MGRERAPDDSTDPTRLGNSDSKNKQGAAGITMLCRPRIRSPDCG
jgi:hypothetical protein